MGGLRGEGPPAGLILIGSLGGGGPVWLLQWRGVGGGSCPLCDRSSVGVQPRPQRRLLHARTRGSRRLNTRRNSARQRPTRPEAPFRHKE